ncbi:MULTISPECIES: TetR/AcrR family transcriptional regulator [Thermomonosporaceae]|uniref:TetR/AcrR family transcriptional regulator n=1 Tax=Thermomonosporaceae TaxID=2012 RepID=UPI00255A7C5B|nr:MULTISPECIES: TetR/AcrR family transcriptional regulator [Thermomonosporaceae]MDL4771936.1 TetR/AcrR family transcriptional regulator [Actinomadura xylanilytica]
MTKDEGGRGGAVLSRRERLRAETSLEIETIALRQLAEEGPGAISLRGIAREMGMTPRAIYSYFPTRDDLITALISGIGASLAEALETAGDAVPGTDPGGRLLAWGRALREWALAHPEGFRLFYGRPVPGYQPPEDGPVDVSARRVCSGLTRLVADAWPHARRHQPEDTSWSDLHPDYVAKIQADLPDVPPAAAALALRVWGRMHGLVALEIDGHIHPVAGNPAALHRAEMVDLVRSLGLPPDGVSRAAE